jgi:hypothetical protein
MLDDLTYNDSDSPVIGIVPAGVPWRDVQDHIKIVHSPLLVELDGGAGYTGAYWAGTELVVVPDLGSDPEEALEEFREFLRERGET